MKITILDERPLVFGILVDQITTYATPQGLQLFCTKNCLPSTKCKEYCLRNSRRYNYNCLSVYLSIHMFYLSIYGFIYLSIYPIIYMSI